MKYFIKQFNKYSVFIIVCLSFLTLTACNYSVNTLKESYNDLGSKYARELKQLADYTPEQSTMLDALGKEVQLWHRKNRLPTYASLIQSVVGKLESSQGLSGDELQVLVKFYWAYPHHYESDTNNKQLAKIAATLSDKQFIQVSKRMQENTREFTKRQQGTWEKKIEGGVIAESEFFGDDLGVDLNKEQLDILRKHYGYLLDPTKTLVSTTNDWNERLIGLLSKRQQPDFVEEFSKHMQYDNVHKRQLRGAPDETQHNEQVAVNMYRELLASFSERQKLSLVSKLKSINRTLSELMVTK